MHDDTTTDADTEQRSAMGGQQSARGYYDWGKVPLWWGNAIEAASKQHRFNALRTAIVLSRARDLETSECRWSTARIGRALGIHRNRVSEAISVLESAGIVTSKRRRGAAATYTLVMGLSCKPAPTDRAGHVDKPAPSDRAGHKTNLHLLTGQPPAPTDRAVSPTISPSTNVDDGAAEEKDNGRAAAVSLLTDRGLYPAQAEAAYDADPDLARDWGTAKVRGRRASATLSSRRQSRPSEPSSLKVKGDFMSSVRQPLNSIRVPRAGQRPGILPKTPLPENGRPRTVTQHSLMPWYDRHVGISA